ncbi:uncharacterized protein [Amphiura filiformis]|uniref:uncharacterized protein n=1 Tax=Amphiura filiformis TaxID=82378 RepID=UPI003B222FEF
MAADVNGTSTTPSWTPNSPAGAHINSNLSYNASNIASLQDSSLLRVTEEPPTISPDYDTWNITLGAISSGLFVLVTAGLLLAVIGLQKYLRRRNQTLSDDTGVFTPRRGSKAGLDMIDNQVVLTGHSSLQRGSAQLALQNELKRHLEQLDPQKKDIVQKLLVHPP